MKLGYQDTLREGEYPLGKHGGLVPVPRPISHQLVVLEELVYVHSHSPFSSISHGPGVLLVSMAS